MNGATRRSSISSFIGKFIHRFDQRDGTLHGLRQCSPCRFNCSMRLSGLLQLEPSESIWSLAISQWQRRCSGRARHFRRATINSSRIQSHVAEY
jgi:hypothetical protein